MPTDGTAIGIKNYNKMANTIMSYIAQLEATQSAAPRQSAAEVAREVMGLIVGRRVVKNNTPETYAPLRHLPEMATLLETFVAAGTKGLVEALQLIVNPDYTASAMVGDISWAQDVARAALGQKAAA
jgi:hypothetical protein